MINRIITYSVRNKLIIALFTLALIGWGGYSLTQVSVDAVPDITDNQVRVITTALNLATQEVEQFITYPVELAMANLPGVKEMRSVSKLGLSIVTIVFEEDMGTYLPRQLVSEQLKEAEAQIPGHMGTPKMAPITTGLGEIYQYILDVKPEFKDQYDIMELRSIQDWIIRRQLSGIPGVVEINSWGGFLKQYEVAVNPEKLRSMNITLTEVYQALESNNENTGGSYIEKGSETFFIRGQGQVQTLKDIRNIVVKTEANIPVTIGDVAEVGFGHAVRYGAITANGEGEKVGGQLLMLKGENTAEVIERIKERITQVQQTLPEGVTIRPFLDRTELIDKTTATVAENLLLGGLIVIFVLVLLIGNMRSGMIVASVIPLSMLFALGMMNLFDVSANLMSLGAIDFGIIIDGAVIIVEFTLFQLASKTGVLSGLSGSERQDKLDELTISSSSRMMRSAIFGQIIILIVFIPILSLTGIEGKMFTPMALTFGFAMLGAMILCLTYVPMVSSVFLNEGVKAENGNLELFEEADGIKLSDDLKQQVEELEGAGKTTMVVRSGNRYLGILGLMDTPREDAKEVIQKLRSMGLTHLIMLTGDNRRVADAVAKEIGIDDPKGNLLPEDKVEAIKQLREGEGHVAMVGDGVNDAPAMANSTVGIAMGAAGSDVALETADVALMADKISVLPFAIGLSRKTKSIIKQNLWISLGMVALLVPATILGLSMGWAVIGHEGSTVVVVFNALRLLGYKS